MKKILELIVNSNTQLNDRYFLLKLGTTDESLLPEMQAGQFVEVKIDNSKVFLRRPFSINFVDRERNELWLLLQVIGNGTREMSQYKMGTLVNIILPLGNSFGIDKANISEQNVLLVGGGVGLAPLLFLGSELNKLGIKTNFLLGAKTKTDLVLIEKFEKTGNVYCTTEDTSYGETGFVTMHTILEKEKFSKIYTCGPKAMMVEIAKYAAKNRIDCEASLENMMACGFGVCLCCVEKTTKGNLCVCTEGPVFNTKDLQWIS